jgi:hydrogenase maturation protease
LTLQRVLVLGYGNPGRLDDGLGPALAAALENDNLPGVTVDSDYQLTVEDADIAARHEIVIFADAAVAGSEPFYFRRIQPLDELGFSSHSVEPAGVLALAGKLFNATPQGFALGIRGYRFNEFGEALSPQAQANLSAALEFLRRALRTGTFEEVGDPPPGQGDCDLVTKSAGSAPAPEPGLSQAGEN